MNPLIASYAQNLDFTVRLQIQHGLTLHIDNFSFIMPQLTINLVSFKMLSKLINMIADFLVRFYY